MKLEQNWSTALNLAKQGQEFAPGQVARSGAVGWGSLGWPLIHADAQPERDCASRASSARVPVLGGSIVGCVSRCCRWHRRAVTGAIRLGTYTGTRRTDLIAQVLYYFVGLCVWAALSGFSTALVVSGIAHKDGNRADQLVHTGNLVIESSFGLSTRD